MERVGPCCRPDDDLQTAARRMASSGRDSLPVCDEASTFLGTLTSHGICLRASQTGQRLADLCAREAVAAPRLSLHPWQTDREALTLMTRARLWQAPVLDQAGYLLGEVRFERLQAAFTRQWGRFVVITDLGELRNNPDVQGVWAFVVGMRKLISPAGRNIQLSRGESRLLQVLAHNAGRTASREALMQGVCNRAYIPGDRYVDVLVSNLRRKFAALDADFVVVRTIHNDGYAFELTVTESTPAPLYHLEVAEAAC